MTLALGYTRDDKALHFSFKNLVALKCMQSDPLCTFSRGGCIFEAFGASQKETTYS